MAVNKPLEFLLNDIDQLIATKIDPAILGREDLSQNLHVLASYRQGSDALADTIREISAEKVRNEALLAKREASASEAASRMPEARKSVRKAKNLGRRIKTNREAIKETARRIARKPKDLAQLEASNAERGALIGQLMDELSAIVGVFLIAHANLKKAETLRKQSATRVANLAKRLEKADRAFNEHAASREAMVELAMKTFDHLRNRQAKHDRKIAERQAKQQPIEVVTTAPIEAPKAPSDQDVIAWAAEHGLPIESENDRLGAIELYQQHGRAA